VNKRNHLDTCSCAVRHIPRRDFASQEQLRPQRSGRDFPSDAGEKLISFCTGLVGSSSQAPAKDQVARGRRVSDIVCSSDIS
jgi:hypothetical protein